MRNVIIVIAGFAIFAACVAGAGVLTSPINEQRRELNLTVSDKLYDLPPEMAVTQAALGTFRGVAINALWQRAENLKNEGKFYEAVELGEWITKLQPKFPLVWEFVSWNQAYNISVATHTPEERWAWVKSGIDILKNEGGGIDANPNSVRLYQQLAWIYHHKVGMFQDNFNWYYKRKLAEEWHALLGEPPKEKEEYLEWFSEIVNAPTQRQDLPEGSRRLLDWLEENGYGVNLKTLDAFTVKRVPIENEDGSEPSLDFSLDADEQPEREAFFRPEQSWPEWATEADIEPLLEFIRRKVLTNAEYNMDPEKMLADVREFGPLDWRHPGSQALYWARRGMDRLEAQELRSGEGVTNTRRQIINSLEQMAQQGRVVYDPVTEYVSYLPVWRYWLKFDDYFQLLKEDNDPEAIEQAYGSGYRNRMDAAIATAELFGSREVAEQLLARMRERYADTPYSDHYGKPLDPFLEQQYADTLENPDMARSAITSLLIQAQSAFWLQNEPERAQQLVEKAKELHDGYREINPNPADPLYHEVPDFPTLQAQAIGGFLTGQAGPMGSAQVPMSTRAYVYAQLDPRMREYLWSINLGPVLQQQALAAGYDPRAVFPQPGELVDINPGITLQERREEDPGPEDATAEQDRK